MRSTVRGVWFQSFVRHGQTMPQMPHTIDRMRDKSNLLVLFVFSIYLSGHDRINVAKR